MEEGRRPGSAREPDRDFNRSYQGRPPWDIGRPQREFVTLADAGRVVGSVLDVGCGTGEHALFLSSRGHDVLGIDSAPAAIDLARAKAEARRSDARFVVADALDLGALDRSFDTAIDCGLFHVFDDTERAVYAASLRAALRPGGRCFIMVFSEREPPGYGPRRVTQREIRETFAEGFSVETITAATFETLLETGDVAGWLAEVRRR